MRIRISLSELSIERAIDKLKTVSENLQEDLEEFMDIILTEGENVANDAYGNMATAWGHRDESRDGIVTGHIGVRGEDDDVVYIAEFGAGDTTMEVTGFENRPPVDVYAGAYSEQVGTGEYAESLAENGETGTWHYLGGTYHEVIPRHGLLNAKAHILASGDDIAREVILHD